MDYEMLVMGVKWTTNRWARSRERRKLPLHSSYEVLRARGVDYWLHLEKMDEAQLGKEIISGFLNTAEWNCHLDKPDSVKGKEMVRRLKSAVDQLPAYYVALDGHRIEDVDFHGQTIVEGKKMSILYVTAFIYAKFRKIKFGKAKSRFGPVPTSKLMHMALPDLFLMWDKAIFRNYRVPSDLFGEHSYIAFLLLMQESIFHIKETHPMGSRTGYQGLFEEINERCGYRGLPMTRLLDIANYAVGNPAKGAPNIECRRCKERTNHRLDELECDPQLAELLKDLQLGRYKL